MPVAKSLTIRIKKQRTPLLLKRDYPLSLLPLEDPDYEEPICCYCGQRFISGHTLWKKTWEHLNDVKTCEYLWNLAWAHWKCNQDKMHDNFDLKFLAQDIIRKNKEWEANYDFDLSSECEKNTHTRTRTDELTDGQINLIFNKMTKLQLETELPKHSTKQIPYDEMKSDILYLVVDQETNGRGSEPAARRSLDGYTKSKYSPWRKRKLGKGNTIIERNLEYKSEIILKSKEKDEFEIIYDVIEQKEDHSTERPEK